MYRPNEQTTAISLTGSTITVGVPQEVLNLVGRLVAVWNRPDPPVIPQLPKGAPRGPDGGSRGGGGSGVGGGPSLQAQREGKGEAGVKKGSPTDFEVVMSFPLHCWLQPFLFLGSLTFDPHPLLGQIRLQPVPKQSQETIKQPLMELRLETVRR